MAGSSPGTIDALAPIRRAASLLILTAITAFLLYTVGEALRSAVSNDDFPESLAVKVELLPVLFPVHMVTGGLALVLLPLTLALRRTRPWHRWVGRATALDVLVAGVTAYPVAWVAPVTFWSAAGFSAQASVWLVLLALGIVNIRRNRVAAHRACMLLMTATAFGAVVFRVLLALWAIAGTMHRFELFYACDAWIAWLLPLGGTTAWLVTRRTRAR